MLKDGEKNERRHLEHLYMYMKGPFSIRDNIPCICILYIWL